MPRAYENFVQSRLNTNITSGTTTIPLQLAVAPYNDPPNPASGSMGRLVVTDNPEDPGAYEVISYTGASTSGGVRTLTGVTRGVEGSTARAWDAGSYLYMAPTKESFQITTLGTAAYADTQTSPTDTTADALMAVGAGGLLGLSSSGDPDSLFGRTSIGRITASIGSAGLHDVINLARLADRNFQLAGATAGSEASAFIRTQGGSGVVTPWRELYHTANLLGTVSQSGGVPTGAVIERGSNSNGEFVRLADGTQICVLTNNSSAEVAARLTSLTAGDTGSYTWTYPAEFSARPEVVADYGSNSEVIRVIAQPRRKADRSATQSVINWRVETAVGGSAMQLDAIAIGRWFNP